jgi:hypothetical protein
MKIFLAPGFLKNIKRSVIEGVQRSELEITDPSLADLIDQEYGNFPLKLWGMKETKRSVNLWRICNKGDLLLFYHGGKFLAAGKVIFKYPFSDDLPAQLEISSKLAEKIWGKDTDGKTWPYLVFISEVQEIDLPLSQFNELTGYRFSAVGGFMSMREERTQKLLDFLSHVRPTKPAKKGVEMKHDQIVDIIYDLGKIIGYKPEKKWRFGGYEFDVVWNKPPRIGPRCVFEIQFKGSIEAALTKLKHAYDLWGSQVFFVSDEDQIEKAEKKFLGGSFHELVEDGMLTLLKLEDITQFYEFKGKFEWLERKFGLKPRG